MCQCIESQPLSSKTGTIECYHKRNYRLSKYLLHKIIFECVNALNLNHCDKRVLLTLIPKGTIEFHPKGHHWLLSQKSIIDWDSEIAILTGILKEHYWLPSQKSTIDWNLKRALLIANPKEHYWLHPKRALLTASQKGTIDWNLKRALLTASRKSIIDWNLKRALLTASQKSIIDWHPKRALLTGILKEHY